jgi:phosphate/sulfate permease
MVSDHTPENRPDLESKGTNPEAEPIATSIEAIEQRLQRNVIISIALFVLVSGLFGTIRFTIGVFFGGLLAYLNYRWLHNSLKTLLAMSAESGKKPDIQALVKFILRWIFILNALGFALLIGGTELAIGLVVGLLSLAGAVIIEAIYQAYWVIQGE